MRKLDLNKNWDFYESDEGMSFVFERPDSVKVDLPHDYIVTKPRSADAAGGGANGYFGEGQGVYRKVLDVPGDWKDKTIIMDIDGAYMNAEVALNGELLGMHPYGYTPYQVDLTPAMRFDGRKNEIKIITQSRQPSTRWYSGGGLYRSVALWLGGSIYLKPWDVFVTTPVAEDDRAVVNFNVTVTSREPEEQKVEVRCEVLDAEGRLTAAAVTEMTLPADGQAVCDVQAEVTEPRRWDIEDPYLYTYRVTVSSGDEILDSEEDTFGIRSISVDTQNGFRLNGRTVNMKGGCIHHDNGLLGACAYPKAEERKIKILKSVGYNAVRISHYPPSLAMLKACDRLGILLLDECFDVWRMGKRPLDYHLYFEDWWERDIEYMVKRDRNHPCVITYSIGNEIGERDGKNDGAAWARQLNDKFKALDPTRFTLSAICGVFEEGETGSNFEANIKENGEDIWGERTKEYAAPLDIVGYNYLPGRYGKDHEKFPDRVILGTETHSFNTYEYWEGVKKYPWVIGDFIWAAVDYLGEVGVGKVYWENDKDEEFTFMTPYPWRTSWQSDILLTGKRRPQSYFREIMWGHTEQTYLFTTHPKHFGENFKGSGWHWPDVSADWSFGDKYVGSMVKVEAYGPGDEAEFILNSKSLGRAPYSELTAVMDIPFEPGVLEAVTYKDGAEVSRAVLKTAKTAAQILLVPEEEVFSADGEDLCYIQVEIQDEDGTVLPADERLLKAEISANAELIAIGSGSPCTEDQTGESTCHAYQGSAEIILKAHEPGEVTVRVSDESGLSGECAVRSV